MGFPGGSDGKESACNSGYRRDMGLIPGSGRSPRGGNGYLLQYSFFFFFILTVFNESCRQDDFILKIWSTSRICVSSLRRGHANLLCIVPILVYALLKRAHYSSILAWRFPWTEKPGELQSTRLQWVRHNWVTKHTHKKGNRLFKVWAGFGGWISSLNLFVNQSYKWSIDPSVQFSHSIESDSLPPHGLQHARPPCPSPTPGAYSNSCPLSWWCHPTILSFVIPFSSCLQSFLASGSFQMSQFFTSGGQRIGVSASASVLSMSIQDQFPLGWTGWISLQSKEFSRVFSDTTQFQSISSSALSFLYSPTLTSIHDYWKNHSFD